MQKNTIRQNKQGTHLTYQDRCTIEALLKEQASFRHIADRINKSPATVSREIRNRSITQHTNHNDCLNKKDCTKHHVCGSANCNGKCSKCNKCKRYCNDYVQIVCEKMYDTNNLCNSCHKIQYCHLEKCVYRASEAQKQYKETLVNRRNGFDLSFEQLEAINRQVSPLIQKGQSPYHIKQVLGDSLIVSESTLRRLIAGNELDVRNIDLPEQVKRKPRRKRKDAKTEELPPPSKFGHLYTDFLEYIEHNNVSVVQMDCIEGTKDSQCVILTLHFVVLHMQLAFILPEHASKCVVDVLDKIEDALGTELFTQVFPLILTDNGHEFWDIDGMERSLYNGKRTSIYFCEPNRSDQKGACEVNHKLIRRILPKGTSFDNLMQSDVTLVTNHVNSYTRSSLYGSCPYDVAMKILPEDFFCLLGLEKIPAEDVVLKPSLLHNTNEYSG